MRRVKAAIPAGPGIATRSNDESVLLYPLVLSTNGKLVSDGLVQRHASASLGNRSLGDVAARVAPAPSKTS